MAMTQNDAVSGTYQSYPANVRRELLKLRELILEVATETPEIGDIEETLKWGEPSYLAAGGSTIRVGWTKSMPEQYSMYFNCNSKLVDSFKQIYPDVLLFEGNRAIVFHLANTIPAQAVKHCIATALQYHKVKHLPLLGM